MGQSIFSKKRMALTVLLCGLFCYAPAKAITVTFEPVTSSAPLGSQAVVDVVIYGFIPDPDYGTPIVVAAYDVGIEYDPTILDLDKVVFGTSLGNLLLEATTSVDDQPGQLTITELSSLDFPDLLDLQSADKFIAATLYFNTVNAGTSALNIGFNPSGTVAYYFEDPIPGSFPDHYGDPGSVTVNAVPEPSAMLLLGSGLLGLVGLNRRRKP